MPARHGVMRPAQSPLELELMRGVEQLFDPAGSMDPGTVFPG